MKRTYNTLARGNKAWTPHSCSHTHWLQKQIRCAYFVVQALRSVHTWYNLSRLEVPLILNNYIHSLFGAALEKMWEAWDTFKIFVTTLHHHWALGCVGLIWISLLKIYAQIQICFSPHVLCAKRLTLIFMAKGVGWYFVQQLFPLSGVGSGWDTYFYGSL